MLALDFFLINCSHTNEQDSATLVAYAHASMVCCVTLYYYYYYIHSPQSHPFKGSTKEEIRRNLYCIKKIFNTTPFFLSFPFLVSFKRVSLCCKVPLIISSQSKYIYSNNITGLLAVWFSYINMLQKEEQRMFFLFFF